MTAPLTTRLTEPALDAASVACAWCGRVSVTNCLICSGRVCAGCVRLSAAGQHMCHKCYRDAVEYAADRVAELNATALTNTRISLSPVRFFHEVIARLEMWSWTGRWMLRGHDRNHDPHFCRHEPKVWLWLMEDGCKGGLCEWCHLLEVWAPTIFPDVAELIRIKPDGTPDEEWVPPSELQFDGIGPTE